MRKRKGMDHAARKLETSSEQRTLGSEEGGTNDELSIG
jgi:hypothetical protein